MVFCRSVSLALTLVLFIFLPLAAQEREGEELHEEIVVTATLSPKSPKDVALNVESLSRKDLERLWASNAVGALNLLPGVFVNRSGEFGRMDIDIRGLGQNGRRVAILVNGRPEKMSLFGCAVTHSFPLDNVERVEIVKGPASVLYGGEALGGVVNILTRRPTKPVETELFTSIGSFGTKMGNLKQGGKFNRWEYFLTYDYQESDGHTPSSAYKGKSATAFVEYRLGESSYLRLSGKFFTGKKEEPGPVENPSLGFWNDYDRNSLEAEFSSGSETKGLTLKAYRNFGKSLISDGWDSKDYTNGSLLHFHLRPSERSRLTLGAEYRRFGGESFHSPRGEWTKDEQAFFFYGEYSPLSLMTLSSGGRLQRDSLYGWDFSPQLGVVFFPLKGTTLRFLVNRGFRSPQLNELYLFPSSQPDLKPERVWNYEMGLDRSFGRFLGLRMSLFRMEGRDLIETVASGKAYPRYIFRNIGCFTFQGAEASLVLTQSPLWKVRGSYGYLDTGGLTRGRPGHKVDLSLDIAPRRFTLSLQGQYLAGYYKENNSRGEIPTVFLLNGRISLPLGRNFQAVVDGKNLFNRGYALFGEFPGLSAGLYPMPRRSFALGVRFQGF